jgi:hypothetical protein
MTDPVPDPELARDREVIAAASPEPWEWWTSNSWRRLTHKREGDVICPTICRSDNHPDLTVSERDMDFIARARTRWAWAVAEIERLRLENDRYRAALLQVDRARRAAGDAGTERRMTKAFESVAAALK